MPSPVALIDVLAKIPDPRDPRGVRHPLSAVLSLAVLAMLTGVKSLTGIAQFGRDKGTALAHALGFRRGKTPSVSTFSEIFRALDIHIFETTLADWVASRLPPVQLSHGEPAHGEPAHGEPAHGQEQLVSLDGKTLRGSKDGEAPGQHLVAAYAAHTKAVLAQVRVDAKTNEHKAALQLLGILPLAGTIIIGDAMFCQRDVCQEIIARGGDYIFFVKDNQPSLAIDIGAGLAYASQARSLAAAFSPQRPTRARTARTPSHQHGQRTRPAGETHFADYQHSHETSGVGGLETRI